MKKLLFLGVTALALSLVVQERASAWINFKFGVGLNCQFQTGNNNWLWGAFKNGPAPGDPFAPHVFAPHQGHYGVMPYGGMPYGGMQFEAPAPMPSDPPKKDAGSSETYIQDYYHPTFHNVSYPGYYTIPNYYTPMNWYYGR